MKMDKDRSVKRARQCQERDRQKKGLKMDNCRIGTYKRGRLSVWFNEEVFFSVSVKCMI